MEEKTKEALEETISHYYRMMAWAKNQPEDDPVSIKEMDDAIGEDWRGRSCPMCLYSREEYDEKHKLWRSHSFLLALEQKWGSSESICIECPLKQFEQSKSRNSGLERSGTACIPEWRKLNRSQTWKDWIEAALNLVNHLRLIQAYLSISPVRSVKEIEIEIEGNIFTVTKEYNAVQGIAHTSITQDGTEITDSKSTSVIIKALDYWEEDQ